MKFIFSLLMIPAFAVGAIAGVLTLFIYGDAHGMRPDWIPVWQNLYFCVFHLAMAGALVLTLLCGVYSAAMCLLGFIVKTWFGALCAGAISGAMFTALFYLLPVVV